MGWGTPAGDSGTDGITDGAETTVRGNDRDDDPSARAALRSVGHGAVVSIAGVSLQKALLFGTNLVLTATLRVDVYGAYALGWRFSRLLVRVAPFGAGPTLVRYLPEYRDDARRNRVVGLAAATALVASLAIATAVFALADRVDAATVDHPAFHSSCGCSSSSYRSR